MKKRPVGWKTVGIAVVACVLAAGCDRPQEQPDPEALAQAQRETAARGVQTLKEAVLLFQLKNPGQSFTELRQLVEGGEPILDGGKDVLVDPWGNAYTFEKRGKRFVVISLGADGKAGTADDIRSDQPREK